MKTLKLDSWKLGGTFDNVAQKAKEIAKEKNQTVSFDFNGIECIVDANTDLGLLWRDYANAHLMDWKIVGVDMMPIYSDDIKAEMARRQKAQDERHEKQQQEYQQKANAEKSAYEEKTKSVKIELLNPELWNDCREKNQDPYGKCAVDYAESWAKLMQVEMTNGKSLIECAEKTSHELGFYGITGFMYGAAVSMLSSCWKHGEELRKWHNKEYKHEGDGVVNPAIMTINSAQ